MELISTSSLLDFNWFHPGPLDRVLVHPIVGQTRQDIAGFSFVSGNFPQGIHSSVGGVTPIKIQKIKTRTPLSVNPPGVNVSRECLLSGQIYVEITDVARQRQNPLGVGRKLTEN